MIEKIASRFKISLSDANAIIFGNNQSANALKKNLVYDARGIKIGVEQEIGAEVWKKKVNNRFHDRELVGAKGHMLILYPE